MHVRVYKCVRAYLSKSVWVFVYAWVFYDCDVCPQQGFNIVCCVCLCEDSICVPLLNTSWIQKSINTGLWVQNAVLPQNSTLPSLQHLAHKRSTIIHNFYYYFHPRDSLSKTKQFLPSWKLKVIKTIFSLSLCATMLLNFSLLFFFSLTPRYCDSRRFFWLSFSTKENNGFCFCYQVEPRLMLYFSQFYSVE